ncbi:predicted protein [Nematostella vectensis]|uniref:Nucleoporin Nup37 n=1 Tax=Nematostella vectensis TaxID=45351 RepID=A7S101_NEMVE|nr:predicted protein [Nematostella vectensis]|eukprot:XP_001634693.1 predicted protein [Nematostella vectensis]
MSGVLPEDNTLSSFTFDCLEIINTVEFSPFKRSSSLIAYGGDKRLAIAVCQFGEDTQEFQFEHVTDFHHGTRVQGIAWSPVTSVTHLPATVQLCSIGGDKQLRIFTTSGKADTSVSVMTGHTGYINACCYEPLRGEQIASVSDDYTCRLWDVETSATKACIPLSSPGMAVKWNPNEPNKLMVAEKKGIIRFYDLVSQQPIMSISTTQAPLMDADWALTDALRVGAVALMTGIYGTCLNQVSCALRVGGGLSWHSHLAICAAGGDKKVHIWAVEV